VPLRWPARKLGLRDVVGEERKQRQKEPGGIEHVVHRE
jgi:hypothetical protein